MSDWIIIKEEGKLSRGMEARQIKGVDELLLPLSQCGWWMDAGGFTVGGNDQGEGFFTLTNCEYKRGQIVLVDDGCRTEEGSERVVAGWAMTIGLELLVGRRSGRLSGFEGMEGNSREGNNNFSIIRKCDTKVHKRRDSYVAFLFVVIMGA